MHDRHWNDIRTAMVSIAALFALVLLWSPAVLAHGDPPRLEFYGDFGAAASCQRAISRAMRVCNEVVTRAHFRCDGAAMRGAECSTSDRDAAISSALLRARETVSGGCAESDLAVLGYLGLADVHRDITQTCENQAKAAADLFYGPSEGGSGAATAEGRECMSATSHAAHRLASASLRQYSYAFKRMAENRLTLGEKQAALALAESRISQVRNNVRKTIEKVCGPSGFQTVYGMNVDVLLDRVKDRSNCLTSFSHVQSEVRCACDGLTSTFDLLQKAIFENKGCTTQFCHDASQSGGLDLRAGHSYDGLVDVPSLISPLKRVERGDRDSSFLYLKLAAKTLGTPVVGTPMPSGALPALTEGELDSVRLWIQQGAPRTGIVPGAESLAQGCNLPPPDPIQIEPPDPPAPGEGVQLKMPEVGLPGPSETEVCFASYYDFSDVVPDWAKSDHGTFFYKSKVEVQDPLSHHLIIHSYRGTYPIDDTSWGDWSCKGGDKNTTPCDPLDPEFCGEGICGSQPKHVLACLGYGPPDYGDPGVAPAFGGTQETYSATRYPAGVYSELPLQGLIVWNSHAFNTTAKASRVRAWVNFTFAAPVERVSQVFGGLLEVNQIFRMGNPIPFLIGGSGDPQTGIPPFTARETCWQHTFDKGSRLFELSSHMHKRGRQFRIWNPQGDLIYQSNQYNDPVQLDFDPPLQLDGTAAERTFRYCATYDNGSTNKSEVKRRSSAPQPPPPFSYVSGFYPCTPSACSEGNVGAPCAGATAAANTSCDSMPGAGDGKCDACALWGGVTTEDEMFLPIAYYYCEPGFPNCKNNAGGGFLGLGG